MYQQLGQSGNEIGTYLSDVLSKAAKYYIVSSGEKTEVQIIRNGVCYINMQRFLE